jgi:hypothetical protein
MAKQSKPSILILWGDDIGFKVHVMAKLEQNKQALAAASK